MWSVNGNTSISVCGFGRLGFTFSNQFQFLSQCYVAATIFSNCDRKPKLAPFSRQVLFQTRTNISVSNFQRFQFSISFICSLVATPVECLSREANFPSWLWRCVAFFSFSFLFYFYHLALTFSLGSILRFIRFRIPSDCSSTINGLINFIFRFR